MPNGKAASLKSLPDIDSSRSRDRGPITPYTAYADVTSSSAAREPAGIRLVM